MKVDTSNGPRPGVALATVAAAFTVAIGITIGALASYAGSDSATQQESAGVSAAELPAALPAAELPAALPAAGDAVDAEVLPRAEVVEVRETRRHESREGKHSRREREREHEDDDDDD